MVVAAVSAFGLMVDTGEIALNQSLSAIFTAQPQAVAHGELAWLLSAVYLGAVGGAPLAGWLSDRHGRRPVLLALLALIVVTSLAAAATTSMVGLIVFRIAAGVALGGYPSLVYTYLAETLPPRLRTQGVMIVSAIAFTGPPVTVMAVRALTSIGPGNVPGWRWVLAGQAACALIAAALTAFLPESPLWALGRERDARPVPKAGRRLSGGGQTPQTLLFGVLFFLSPLATVVFPLLVGAALVQQGLGLSTSLLVIAVSSIAPIAGPIGVALLSDSIDRRHGLVGLCILGGAGLLGFIFSDSASTLMMSMFVFYFATVGYVILLNLYTAESFATELRGRVMTGVWSLNRLCAVISPFVLLPLLHGSGHGHGRWTLAAAAFAALALSAGLILAFGPAVRGREQLT
ncbi:MAG: MFS transporter [Caulobacteraceae bacterium]